MLEAEGSRVRGLLESGSWPYVGTQIKNGPYVVICTACKRTHNKYETSCGFWPHPWECLNDIGSIRSISIWPDYKYLKVNH